MSGVGSVVSGYTLHISLFLFYSFIFDESVNLRVWNWTFLEGCELDRRRVAILN